MPIEAALRAPETADEAALLALNNAHAIELSALTTPALRALLADAFRARVAGACRGMIIAFDQDASYRSPNFLWFRARYPRFVYVDRVVVEPAARGRGIARALYDDLFAASRVVGHEHLCCEVNIDPPNPASDRFHQALGFVEVGREHLPAYRKTVRYLRRNLAA